MMRQQPKVCAEDSALVHICARARMCTCVHVCLLVLAGAYQDTQAGHAQRTLLAHHQVRTHTRVRRQ